MFEDTALITAMGKALAKLLTPVVRLLLKHSFSYLAFEEIAKRVYVEVAMEDTGLGARKPTVSRAAVMTGLSRKDVKATLAKPWGTLNSEATHYSRAARVLTAWVRDKSLRQLDGSSRALTATEFGELVKVSSGDMTPKAVFDELVRVGAVRERDDGYVELINRAYVPSESAVSKVNILGTDASELLETIIFNIEREHGSAARYQRKVMHTGIPSDLLPAFQKLSSDKAQELLELLDGWLADRDLRDVPQEQWPATARVGLGIYYYEQRGNKSEARK